MSRALIFLPEVSRDLIEGFNYYEALAPERGGDRFEAAFKKAVVQIESGTITHFQPFDYFHRVILTNYPYNIYYRMAGKRAVITALLYSRFDPKRIQEMLVRRGQPS